MIAGTFQYHASDQPHWAEDHFKEHHLFYEFFHGDTGQGWCIPPNRVDGFNRQLITGDG